METHAAPRDRISIRDDVVYREIDGEIVALSIATGEYATFDDVGSRIWRLIEQFGAVLPIKAALLAEYDLDEATCVGELHAFVSMLEEKGLITCGSN